MVLAALVLAPFLPVLVLLSVRRPFLVLGIYAGTVPFASLARLRGAPVPFDGVSTVIGLFATGAIAVHLATSVRRGTYNAPTVPIWLLYLAVTSFTAIYSINTSASAKDVPILVSLIALYVLLSLVRVDRRDLRLVENMIAMGGGLTGLLATYQLLTGTLARTNAGELRFESAGGGDADANITAAALLLPFILNVVNILRYKPVPQRLLYVGCGGLTLVAIVLTGSRGGLVSLTVGILITLVVGKFGIRYALAIVLAGASTLLFLPSSTADRVDDTDSTGRTEIWRIGLSACPKYCAFGAGLGAFPDVHEEQLLTTSEATGTRLRFQAHNMWVGNLVENGVSAIVLLFFGFAMTVKELMKVGYRLRGPALGALGALLASQMFLDNVAFKYFWLILMYTLMVRIVAREGESDEADELLQPESLASGQGSTHPASQSPAPVAG